MGTGARVHRSRNMRAAWYAEGARGTRVRRRPSHSLLGTALVLYMVAEAASAQGALDALGGVAALIAGVLALTPALLSRDELAGGRRVDLLALSLVGSLLRMIAPDGASIAVDAVSAICISATAALVVDLALTVPDSLMQRRGEIPLRVAVWLLAASSAGGAIASQIQMVAADAAWYARSPLGLLAGGLCFALALRWLRRRAGGSAESLASNGWALLGLWPASGLALALAFALREGSPLGALPIRGAALAGSCVLLWSHLRLLDPARRSSIGAASRAIPAAVVTLGLLAGAGVLSRGFWPKQPWLLCAAIAAVMVVAFVLHRTLRGLAEHWLAPARGRLLRAFAQAQTELDGAVTFEDVARVALGAARRASGDPRAEPILYVFNPVIGMRLDAAGIAHTDALLPHSELVRALREGAGQILLRRPIEAQLVRKPALRPLIEVLAMYDVLCVVPLVQHAELEGALLLTRGTRQRDLVLEELEALQRFGAHLAGLLTVLCAEARAQRRSLDAQLAKSRAEAECERARGEALRLEREARALRVGGALAPEERPELAYSPSMRALFTRLRELSARDEHVLLWAESGDRIAPFARILHDEGPRAELPLVQGECGSLPAEQAAALLLGSEPAAPGWLQVARDGTLVLADLQALSMPVQQDLARALGAPRTAAGARIVASCRRDPRELAGEGRLDPELLGCFECLRVPPLRQRVEDLPSLVLLALDHSARVLGRPPVGIEQEAQLRLLEYGWPGNRDELESVIECAVARCTEQRVSLSDLPPLGRPAPAEPQPEGHPLDGTLDFIERRALCRALERTHGNKSEAARILGLKRTTFLDKLRRHRLDGRANSLVSN
jgi:DNA-binding NtrC family response regulator